MLSAWVDAVDAAPMRAEATVELARWLRQNGRLALARQFAHAATRLPTPHDALIVEASVYEWRARDELAMACFACGDRRESARLWRELLADPRLPASERERVQRNLGAMGPA